MLLTVDDDAAVSRAVARDLRRQYGEQFRVLRAESGPQALEAIKEVALRGEQVALILADYRMPVMNGIEFLEQAMDLVPDARRVLLTAYADTDAAISAINLVDVDHYLVKPWEPPEEKLYPVVDQLVALWRSTVRSGRSEIKLLGHRWSRPSFEVRDFLSRNGVPYRWYSVEEPEGQRLLALADATPEDVPVVVDLEGEVLRRPTTAELAQAVGMSTLPERGLLRPGDHRRRPGRARCRGLRRVRGPEHGRGRAAGTRRAGGPELADRELPRLPRRRLRQPAHRPRAPAGAAVRHRDALCQNGHRACAPPGRRRSSPSTTARRSPRTRWCCPPASPTASSTPTAPRTSSGAASTTGRRPPRPRPASAGTWWSSAARTRPARRRCSSPGTPRR